MRATLDAQALSLSAVCEGLELLPHWSPNTSGSTEEDAAFREFLQVGIDLKAMSVLGHGKMGAAYAAGNQLVAKFTTDVGEANTSAYVRDLGPLEHIWKIYHVYQLSEHQQMAYIRWARPVPEEIYSHDAYLIIGEQLSPIPDRPMVKIVYRWIKDVLGVKNSNQMDEATFRSLSAIVEAMASGNMVQEPPAEGNAWVPIARFYLNALRELQEFGVGFRDFHSANVMVAPGGHRKLIDLGLSSNLDLKSPLDSLGLGV